MLEKDQRLEKKKNKVLQFQQYRKIVFDYYNTILHYFGYGSFWKLLSVCQSVCTAFSENADTGGVGPMI